MEKTYTVYQRNACKSITDERDRAGSGENDLCQKKNKTLCRARPARHASARREKRTYVRAGLFVKDQNIKTRKRNAREDLESEKPSAETLSQGTMPSARKLDPKKPRAGKLELIQLSEFGSVAL